MKALKEEKAKERELWKLLRGPSMPIVSSFAWGRTRLENMIEIFKIARDSGRSLLLSVVNWGEVYYITLQEAGPERADAIAHLLATLPIQLVPVDLEIAKKAAEFKAGKKMSYADCFAAALAQLRKAELITGDKDFKQLEGEVKILWIA